MPVAQVDTNSAPVEIEILVECKKLDNVVLIVLQVQLLAHYSVLHLTEGRQEVLLLQVENAEQIQDLMEVPLLERRHIEPGTHEQHELPDVHILLVQKGAHGLRALHGRDVLEADVQLDVQWIVVDSTDWHTSISQTNDHLELC